MTTSSIDGSPSSPLLRDLVAYLRTYLVLTPAQHLVLAVWVVHTHVYQVADFTPYLSVRSPEPRCGKSTLALILEAFSAKAWLTVEPSEAVTYRKIAKESPTMLLDEVDAIFNATTEGQHEGLRALLNAGNRAGARVPRCVGGGSDLIEFLVYCPKALFGIGTLPTTLADRSIPIVMKRKTKEESTSRFRQRTAEAKAAPILERIKAWAAENRQAVNETYQNEPELPDELNDRMQDACEILVAIADVSGDGDVVRQALVELAGGDATQVGNESMKVHLLRDLRELWASWEHTSNMPTNVLIPALRALPHGRWSSYYGREFMETDLASLLRHYEVRPKSVHVSAGVLVDPETKEPKPAHTAQGYKYMELAEAWTRYVPEDVPEEEVEQRQAEDVLQAPAAAPDAVT